MNKRAIGVVIFLLYGVPFVFFAMYADFRFHNMFGYLLMICSMSLFAYAAIRFSQIWASVIGNILSAATSYICLFKMDGNENWGGYFKPFYPETLFVLVSLLILIPQMFFICRAYVAKRKTNT